MGSTFSLKNSLNLN